MKPFFTLSIVCGLLSTLLYFVTDFPIGGWLGIPYAIFAFLMIGFLGDSIKIIWQRVILGGILWGCIPFTFGANTIIFCIILAIIGSILALFPRFLMELLHAFFA